MRQRNTSPYGLVMPTLDPPREVAPGEVIDHPTLLAGFESLDPPTDDPEHASDDTEGDVPVPSDSESAADQAAAEKPRRRKTAAVTAEKGENR